MSVLKVRYACTSVIYFSKTIKVVLKVLLLFGGKIKKTHRIGLSRGRIQVATV